MLKRFIAILLLIFISANMLFATTYYVSTTGNDSNNGSSGSPWLTIGVSIAKLHAGDTLIVTAGTYVETSTYSFSVSGTASSPITILGQNAIIDIHATGDQLYNFNGNYVVVDGLKFTMTLSGGMNSGGVLGINGNNCTFRNLEIYNISAALISGYGGDLLYCIVSGGGSSYNTCLNLFIHDIKNGDIFRIWGYTNRITSCTVSNCSNPNYNYSGSSQLHADFVQSFGDNNTPSIGNIFENNYTVNNDIDLGCLSQDSRSNIHDNVWRNNIFVNFGTCIFMGQHNTMWYNNLFINDGANPGCALRVDGGTDTGNGWDAAGSQFINNAFITYSIEFQGGLTASQFTIANNYYGTSSYGALGAIGTSAVNGGNPQFAGAPNYHIGVNSVLKGAGKNLTGDVNAATFDKDGNLRPSTGNWDIGPYEYYNSSLTNPVIAVTPASANFGTQLINNTTDLTFTVKNVGAGTLAGTASVLSPFAIIAGGTYSLGSNQSQSVTVRFSPVAAGNYSQTVAFTGGGGANVTVSGAAINNVTPSVSAISANASDIAPSTTGLQIYGGSVVQLSGTATNALTYRWSYTVNGGSSVIYQSGSGAIAAASFTYGTNTIGNTYVWTLTVSNGQASAQSQLTLSVVAPPVVSPGLVFAAESGTTTAPFIIASTVVNGVTNKYIYQPTQTTGVASGGSATYGFTITNAGNYVIQALVNAPNDGANSLYVNIDAQPQDPTMIWDVTLTSGFEQRIVSWRGNGTDTSNQFVPEYFNLTQGTHQLIIVGREANVQLQSLAILKTPSPPQNLRILSP